MIWAMITITVLMFACAYFAGECVRRKMRIVFLERELRAALNRAPTHEVKTRDASFRLNVAPQSIEEKYPEIEHGVACGCEHCAREREGAD